MFEAEKEEERERVRKREGGRGYCEEREIERVVKVGRK